MNGGSSLYGIKEWLQVQVQSEVVLFQGSISRSGLGYVVDYILYISISGMYSINDMVRSILYFRNG